MSLLKIIECKQGRIYDLGFVDPDVVHQHNLIEKPNETEDLLVRALRRQETKRKIIFPYNFGCLSYTHSIRLLDVKCN